MEIFDLYDRDRNLLNRDHIRGEEIPEGCYHLVISVWIKNQYGKYLMSKRADHKKNYPGMWECTCGNILKGEDSKEGTIREVREELGIELNKDDLHLVFTEILEEQHYIYDVYEIEYHGKIKLKKATCDEVSEAKWMSKSQIESLHQKGLFRDDITYFFDTIEKGGNYVYMVECNDHSYYTGWTNHLEKRLEAHNLGKGAKYTKARRPVSLVYYEEYNTKKEAMQREYEIKQMTRKEKEILVNKKV